MRLLLDASTLGQLCHPKEAINRPVTEWLSGILADRHERHAIYLPEIADYELRRELIHLVRRKKASQRSLKRLDSLKDLLEFLPLDSETLCRAAELWAEARLVGMPTAHPLALDGDVILAAQAESVQATIVTSNRKHLSRFVPAFDWTEIQTGPRPRS
jgi:predicted nucleic acid-binding protein